MCLDKSPLYRNLFKQELKRHRNGFSPEESTLSFKTLYRMRSVLDVTCVFPFVRIQLGLGEESLATALTE